MDRLVVSRPNDKHVGLDLTLIGCINIFAIYTSRIMKCIEDDTNALGII